VSVSEHIHKRHNKTLLLYHLVFPVKYRKKVFTNEIEQTLKNVCEDMSIWYEIHFIEIWVDKDHVHFLIQSVPKFSVTEIVTKIKSITAKAVFKMHPELKKKLWWWNFWTSWFYANTVWQYANEDIIKQYVKNQWMEKEYKELSKKQLTLFEGLV
jgi:putative transposase